MTARLLRLARPLLITGTIWLSAAGAHVLGGGMLPAAEISAALTVLVLLAVVMTMGRRLSLGRITGVLGIGQVLLHEAFSLFSHGAGCDASVRVGHHAEQAGECLSPAPLLHADTGFAMSLTHLLAAAATAAIFSRAEAMLWRFVAWFRPLTHALQPAAIPGSRPDRDASAPRPTPSPWRTHGTDGIRGPPGHRVPLARPV